MGTEKSLVLFESKDGSVELPVMLDPEREDVWLSRTQLATLFGRDVKTIGKHVANALREELAGSENRTVAKIATVQTEGTRRVVRQVEHYNLDMVLSVGYRVKSARGVEFRRWATDVLRRYIVAGHAENERRLEQLGQVAKIMARVPESLESRQILDIVQSYTGALDLLDDYDHLSVTAPEGTPATREITYEECREVIESLRFGRESSLFGVEKDESFKGAVGNVFQSFGGRDLYPTLEEKAAHLLYFVVKDHSFLDGNKRIAAAVFLYFLDRNRALFTPSGEKSVEDRKSRGEALCHVLHVVARTECHVHLAAAIAENLRASSKIFLNMAKRQTGALLLLPHREVRVAPSTVRRVFAQPVDPALVPDRAREACARRKARLLHERVERKEPTKRVATDDVGAGRLVEHLGKRSERLFGTPAKVFLARAQRRSRPRRERIAPVRNWYAHHA